MDPVNQQDVNTFVLTNMDRLITELVATRLHLAGLETILIAREALTQTEVDVAILACDARADEVIEKEQRFADLRAMRQTVKRLLDDGRMN